MWTDEQNKISNNKVRGIRQFDWMLSNIKDFSGKYITNKRVSLDIFMSTKIYYKWNLNLNFNLIIPKASKYQILRSYTVSEVCYKVIGQ